MDLFRTVQQLSGRRFNFTNNLAPVSLSLGGREELRFHVFDPTKYFVRLIVDSYNGWDKRWETQEIDLPEFTIGDKSVYDLGNTPQRLDGFVGFTYDASLELPSGLYVKAPGIAEVELKTTQ